MNIERTMLKGQIADLKKRLKDKDLEASSLIISLRIILNPYESDVCLIDSEKALVTMKRLNEIINEMRQLKEQLNKFEEAVDG